MKRIPLSKTSATAIVDDKDFRRISQCTWWINSGYPTSGYYEGTRKTGRKWICVRMHTLLFLPNPGFCVDHRNGNKLDNRRANLRFASNQENCQNMRQAARKSSRSSSTYKGVSWDKERRLWKAHITVSYRYIHLGRFTDERDAARAYNAAATKYFGEFACPNKL